MWDGKGFFFLLFFRIALDEKESFRVYLKEDRFHGTFSGSARQKPAKR